MAKAEFTAADDALLDALGVEVEVNKIDALTHQQERIIAGFEEIQNFVQHHHRLPQSDNHNIFERLYAIRLEHIREQQECRDLLDELDPQNLLDPTAQHDDPSDQLSDQQLLDELGGDTPENDLSILRHVKPRAEIRAAEEIAGRNPCKDFHLFKPLFVEIRHGLNNRTRSTRQIRKEAGFLKTEIQQGQFFILNGQIAYVANVGDISINEHGFNDGRLRVIYDNGTESNLLLRSLQRALYKDNASRHISEPQAGPLFSDTTEQGDQPSGTIYVAASTSDHPEIRQYRGILHKIGVTDGSVEKRIANAARDPTFLMAPVEIAATYELYNIDRTKLENIIHKFFADARIDSKIIDRFGLTVAPREWFLVPISAIDEAIKRIKDKTISQYLYDVENARLILSSNPD